LAENGNNQSAMAAPTQYVLGSITGKEPKLTIQFKESKIKFRQLYVWL
jgi:hypothetical protein